MRARSVAAGDGDWVVDLGHVGPGEIAQAGGKAAALAAMVRSGLRIPGGLCVTTAAYDRFVDATGLRPAISLELGRKRFQDMRWEEVWDASLRIRNLFLRAVPDPSLDQVLGDALGRRFGDGRRAVVRSSAPAEDTATTTFAGLHDSYVNVRGVQALLEAIRGVWASLWTDRALLYRKELGLDVLSSSMAVVVQELIVGAVSGVAFSQSPLDNTQAVVEAVWGLNEGLVDGTVEPDRWIFERASRTLVDHHEPARRERMSSLAESSSGTGGTRLMPLAEAEQLSPPLTVPQAKTVFSAALSAERLFDLPQDVEWTIAGGDLWILQSRPISTLGSTVRGEADAVARERAAGEVEQALGTAPLSQGTRTPRDERPWYLNLQRSFGRLLELRHEVEEVAIPQMESEVQRMAAIDLAALTDADLAAEIDRRQESLGRWEEVYYRDFIPLAHGVRLFGQVYNDRLRPADPYEFVDLLSGSGLLSVSRNALLAELAHRIAAEHEGRWETEGPLETGESPETGLAAETGEAPALRALLDDYLDRFGSGPGTPEAIRAQERTRLIRLASEMVRHPSERVAPADGADRRNSTEAAHLDRTENYLAHFQGQERVFQEQLLDLARASYRLRDDDNVHLDRLRRLTQAALAESRARSGALSPGKEADQRSAADQEPATRSPTGGRSEEAHEPLSVERFKTRQIVGQPAGPGLAVGRARVVVDEADLYAFESGEVLVCDSLDPTMTFVVPLASAIVERRGGMLVHGAIIAREYGLPCVTGVTGATEDIHTGDLLTVDGFLGIVVVGGTPPDRFTPEHP